MAIQLHSWPRSSGTRVSWALEELGVPYEYVELDPKQGEHRSPGYLALNPHGKVPTLVDDGEVFFESGAILLHLGDKYGRDRQLWPAGGGQPRADALSWTVWAVVELGPYLLQWMYHGLDTPISFKAGDRSKAAAEYSRSQFVRCLDALQARLETREHLLGAFSLVDVGCASWLMLGASLGAAVDDGHPRVAAWRQRCAQRPAVTRAR
jgi:glutathione S-transferase